MRIDDPIAANILTQKISATLPFKVYLGKHLMKLSEKDGYKTDSKTAFEVDWVGYSGDEGGIMCALEDTIGNGKKYVTSITHIKIDPDHLLASEIEAYQRERTMKLAIQDSRGFLKEFITGRSPKSKSKIRKKGFGQL